MNNTNLSKDQYLHAVERIAEDVIRLVNLDNPPHTCSTIESGIHSEVNYFVHYSSKADRIKIIEYANPDLLKSMDLKNDCFTKIRSCAGSTMRDDVEKQVEKLLSIRA